MMNSHRAYYLITFDTIEELAEYLFRFSSLVRCAGLRVGNIAYLNDSFTEDSVQEYAAVLITEEEERTFAGIQFESLTISWMKPEEFIRSHKRYATFETEGIPESFTWQSRLIITKHGEERCWCCA